MPRHQRRNQRRRRRAGRRRGLAVAALVVALPVIAWFAYAFVIDDDPGDENLRSEPGATTSQPSAPDDGPEDEAGTSRNDASGSTSTPSATSTPDSDAPDRSASEAIATCAAALDAGADVITKAETGITHWSEHIGAREDWLAGRISDDEKAATYKRTRLAGPDDQQRFHGTLSAYDDLPGCADLISLATSGDTTDLDQEIQACLSRHDHTEAVISAGAEAMADWQEHLDDMATYADGQMSNAEANAGWQAAAENAPININAFHAARDEWIQAPECD